MGNKLSQSEKDLLPQRTLYRSADGYVLDVTGYDRKHYVFRKKQKIKDNLLKAKKKPT